MKLDWDFIDFMMKLVIVSIGGYFVFSSLYRMTIALEHIAAKLQ